MGTVAEDALALFERPVRNLLFESRLQVAVAGEAEGRDLSRGYEGGGGCGIHVTGAAAHLGHGQMGGFSDQLGLC